MTVRTTRQLGAVLEAVNLRRDHPTAQEVYARVRQRLPRISRGTVYRNLSKLQQQRQIRIVRLAGRPARYDAVVHEHDHFVCEGCSAVEDLVTGNGRHPGAVDLRASGYVLRRRSITYFGLCPRCALCAKEG
jgi:Fur family ferric uptake transcriptional regulator